MQSASHLACDWWEQHPSFWRWLPSFIGRQESKCEDFWFSIYSCPFIVVLAINRISFQGPHTIFFPKQALFYSALFSSKIPQFSSLLWKVGQVEWGRGRYHPSWFLSGVFEEMRKEECSSGLGDSISSLYTNLREPRFKMNYLFQPFMSLWQMAICLPNVNSALPPHRGGTEQCSRCNHLPRHLCH